MLARLSSELAGSRFKDFPASSKERLGEATAVRTGRRTRAQAACNCNKRAS
jgi:hypothetical protein